jgi:hypothetical protein
MNIDPKSRRREDRRRLVLRLAAAGALGAGGLTGVISRALAKGDLPPGVHQLTGTATVNGRPAQVGTAVSPRDKVATGAGSTAILVMKDDAFLVRQNTALEFGESRGALSRVLLQTGQVLAVFGKKPVEIQAKNATVGIRGTGAYIEVEPAEIYLCLCYGEADVAAPGMATQRLKTTHHEQPLLLVESGGGVTARPGGFRNHTDDELTLLESLVGREPPFAGNPDAKPYFVPG